MTPFWLHTFSSIISGVLIIYLSLSCRFNKLGHHKLVSIVMGLTGVISLVSSFVYGFTLELSFDLIQFHYYAGFISLILSLVPFFRYLVKSSEWHYRVGDFAAVFAVISLVTGFINYWGVIFPPLVNEDCLTLSDLESDARCLVAVSSVVYDMTLMPRWQSGTHFDYQCGGSYDKDLLPPSHELDKYYGPVIGKLC